MRLASGTLDMASGGIPDSDTDRGRQPCSVRAANREAIWSLLRKAVFAILLIRASSDPVFNLLAGDSGAASMGVGALFNVAAIAIAGMLFLQAPLKAPFPVIAIWGPYLLVAFGSTLYAPDFSAAARLAFVLLSYWAFFAIPFFILRSSRDLTRFVLVVIGSSLPPTLYAFVDIARGLPNFSDFRLQSTFSHPNIYAFYLVLLLGLALYVRASQAVDLSRRIRRLVPRYNPHLAVVLLLTKPRSAWGVCGVMFLVYAVRVERRFLFGLLLVPLMFVSNPSLMDRLTDVTAATEVDDFSQLNDSNRLNSYVWRQALWESAIPQVMDRPLLGHGLETFKPATPRFFPLIGPQGIDGHNFYLQMSFELGIAGLLAVAWLFGCVARRLAKGWRRDPAGILVVSCILMAYVLESYSDNMHFYLSFNWYFWFGMGTICAGRARGDTPRRRDRARPGRAGGQPPQASPLTGRHQTMSV